MNTPSVPKTRLSIFALKIGIGLLAIVVIFSIYRVTTTSSAAASQRQPSQKPSPTETVGVRQRQERSEQTGKSPERIGPRIFPEVSFGRLYEQPPDPTKKESAALLRSAARSELLMPKISDVQLASAIPSANPPIDPKVLPPDEGTGTATQKAAGPNDLKFLTVSDLPASAAPSRSLQPSPSVSAAYGAVFMTGNWFAARSLDFGRTWKYVSPFSTFPSVNNGFCCQQDTIYDNTTKSFFWSLSYSPDSTSNSVRLARADLNGLTTNSWVSYRFTPEDFGYGTGHFFDDPKISLTESYLRNGSSGYKTDLVLVANVFKISGQSYVGTVLWRIDTAQLAAGATITPRYYKTDVSGIRCTTGIAAAGDITCAGFATTSKLRIFVWEGTTIRSNDITAPTFAWMSRDGVATTPDGKNWAGGITSDVQAIWTEPPPSLEGHAQNLIVAWAAKQDATHPYPYVIYSAFLPSETSWTVGNKYTLWSNKTAWLFPAAADDGLFAAGSAAYGGGEYYPGTNLWLTNAGSPTSGSIELIGAASSNAGPVENKWGWSFTVRDVYSGFVAATYYLKDGGNGANVVPRFLWFGRDGALTPGVAAVNAASFQNAIARDSIAAVFGSNLASQSLVAPGPPQPMLGNRLVLINQDDLWLNAAVPRPSATNLFFVSPGQLNLHITDAARLGGSVMQVADREAKTYGFGVIDVVNVAPGLFSADASGRGAAASVVLRVRADGSQSYEPVARWDGTRYATVPIDLGPATDQVFLILYGTGFRYRTTLSTVSVRIGGIDSPVLYAGPQGTLTGLDQANIRLPQSLAGRGEMDVLFTADGQTANPIRINVR